MKRARADHSGPTKKTATRQRSLAKTERLIAILLALLEHNITKLVRRKRAR
jgi:hypothetical protein